MTFHEQLAYDIANTFLNEDEFSTTHRIGNGISSANCKMVVNGTGAAALLSGVELRAGHISIVLQTVDLPAKHSYGSKIFLDGKAYEVENEPIDEYGLTELLLKCNF